MKVKRESLKAWSPVGNLTHTACVKQRWQGRSRPPPILYSLLFSWWWWSQGGARQRADSHSERIPLNGPAGQEERQQPANRCKPTRKEKGREDDEEPGPPSLGTAPMAGAQIRLSKD